MLFSGSQEPNASVGVLFEKVYSFFFLLQEEKANQGILVLESYHQQAEIQIERRRLHSIKWYGVEIAEARVEQSALGPEGVSVSCCFSELIKWDLVPFSQASISRWVSCYLVTISHSLVQTCSTALHPWNLAFHVGVGTHTKHIAHFKNLTFRINNFDVVFLS